MKRISSFVGVCLLAGAFVPAASAALGGYSGDIDDGFDGVLAFEVVKTDDGRFVRALEADIHVNCEEDSGALDLEAQGRFRVKHGHWDGTRPTGNTEIGKGGEVTFTGEVKGDEADGTIKFVDEKSDFGRCRSGKRDWAAEQLNH